MSDTWIAKCDQCGQAVDSGTLQYIPTKSMHYCKSCVDEFITPIREEPSYLNDLIIDNEIDDWDEDDDW